MVPFLQNSDFPSSGNTLRLSEPCSGDSKTSRSQSSTSSSDGDGGDEAQRRVAVQSAEQQIPRAANVSKVDDSLVKGISRFTARTGDVVYTVEYDGGFYFTVPASQILEVVSPEYLQRYEHNHFANETNMETVYLHHETSGAWSGGTVPREAVARWYKLNKQKVVKATKKAAKAAGPDIPSRPSLTSNQVDEQKERNDEEVPDSSTDEDVKMASTDEDNGIPTTTSPGVPKLLVSPASQTRHAPNLTGTPRKRSMMAVVLSSDSSRANSTDIGQQRPSGDVPSPRKILAPVSVGKGQTSISAFFRPVNPFPEIPAPELNTGRKQRSASIKSIPPPAIIQRAQSARPAKKQKHSPPKTVATPHDKDWELYKRPTPPPQFPVPVNRAPKVTAPPKRKPSAKKPRKPVMPVEYEMESIMDHRLNHEAGGRREFLIKWVGYSMADNTWEPEENLKGSEDAINEYEMQLDEL